ncbi:hypothetical protein JCM4914_47690 [Streptomyces platensis subsp. malvinus]
MTGGGGREAAGGAGSGMPGWAGWGWVVAGRDVGSESRGDRREGRGTGEG